MSEVSGLEFNPQYGAKLITCKVICHCGLDPQSPDKYRDLSLRSR